MPRGLLKAIEQHVPGLLGAADVRFESRLRELAATGFDSGCRVFSEVLDYGRIGTEEFPREAIATYDRVSDRRMRRMITDGFAADDLRAGPMAERARVQSSIDERIRARLKGYAGWLTTEAAFVAEVATYRNEYLDEAGDRFVPDVEVLADKVRARVEGSPGLQEVEAVGGMLLSKWSLQTFCTWELPEPRHPSLWTGEDIPANGIAPTGVSMFLPWPLLADKDLKLRELTEYHWKKANLDHLEEWLEGDKRWGHERYGRMLELYIYWWQGLRRRYADRLTGHFESLERAFAAFWNPSASPSDVERSCEGVRRIRRQLKRRLEKCDRAVVAGIGGQIPGSVVVKSDDRRSEDELLEDVERDLAEQRREKDQS